MWRAVPPPTADRDLSVQETPTSGAPSSEIPACTLLIPEIQSLRIPEIPIILGRPEWWGMNAMCQFARTEAQEQTSKSDKNIPKEGSKMLLYVLARCDELTAIKRSDGHNSGWKPRHLSNHHRKLKVKETWFE